MSDTATSMPAQRRRARHYAMQALYQWQISRNDVSDIERQFLTEYDFKPVDTEYFHELLHQVPAQLDRLDAALEPLLDRPLRELTPIERAVLYIGAYELLQRIDIPYRVAINEAVALTKKFGAAEGHKFVNGVLDKLARQVRTVETGAGSDARRG